MLLLLEIHGERYGHTLRAAALLLTIDECFLIYQLL